MSELFMNYHPDPYIRSYTDRGMAKWLGFYLSEHTAEMNVSAIERSYVPIRKEAMTLETISEMLAYAYQQRKRVTIQLDSLSLDGVSQENQSGMVEGIDENVLFLRLNPTVQINQIPLESIKFIGLYEQPKWSELS